jgi:phosphonate transport system ATP-binding protein
MRLLCELCTEHGLAAVINIHDVQLAQLFVQRIVGLRAGRVVFDGPPAELDADVLTKIYGEEDWTATFGNRAGDKLEDEDGVEVDEERMAGLA